MKHIGRLKNKAPQNVCPRLLLGLNNTKYIISGAIEPKIKPLKLKILLLNGSIAAGWAKVNGIIPPLSYECLPFICPSHTLSQSIKPGEHYLKPYEKPGPGA